MSNNILTNDMIVDEALLLFENNLRYLDCVHRGYEPDFKASNNGYRKGSTVSIKVPAKVEVKTGAVLQIQDQTEGKRTVTVDTHVHVGIQFTAQDRTLKASAFGERFLKDPMIKFADYVDRAVAANYKYVANLSGSPGTAVDTFAKFNSAITLATDLAMEKANRQAVLNPNDFGALQSAFTGSQSEKIVEGVFGKRRLPVMSETPMSESANAPRHTVGVATGTPRVNGASQNVTHEATSTSRTQSLITDGWTNSTTGILKAGDQFTIANVYAVNPVNGQVLVDGAGNKVLRSFVVEADADSGASTGPATLTISPKIITSGPYQTVDAAPADDALITVKGTGGATYRQNLIMVPRWAHLTCVPLEPLEGIQGVTQKTANGLTLTMTPVADAQNYVQAYRLDLLFGTGPLEPEHAMRFYG